LAEWGTAVQAGGDKELTKARINKAPAEILGLSGLGVAGVYSGYRCADLVRNIRQIASGLTLILPLAAP
jgi:hypothetical protein